MMKETIKTPQSDEVRVIVELRWVPAESENVYHDFDRAHDHLMRVGQEIAGSFFATFNPTAPRIEARVYDGTVTKKSYGYAVKPLYEHHDWHAFGMGDD